jgi:hypothetical protein
MGRLMLTYKEFASINESLNMDVGKVHRDHPLEMLAKLMLPETSHPTVMSMYNDHMDKNDLRILKFKNNNGHIEYHIHSNSVFPGTKSTNESKLGFMSAVKLIHHDASTELEKGNPIALQSIEGSHQYEKYKEIASRLATKAGKTVKDVGIHPLSSAPFLRGPMLVVE